MVMQEEDGKQGSGVKAKLREIWQGVAREMPQVLAEVDGCVGTLVAEFSKAVLAVAPGAVGAYAASFAVAPGLSSKAHLAVALAGGVIDAGMTIPWVKEYTGSRFLSQKIVTTTLATVLTLPIAAGVGHHERVKARETRIVPANSIVDVDPKTVCAQNSLKKGQELNVGGALFICP